MLATDDRHVVINLGNWVSIQYEAEKHARYHFAVKFEFDRLSGPLAILSFVLLTAIILGGGFFPQVFIASSHRAAEASTIVTREPGE